VAAPPSLITGRAAGTAGRQRPEAGGRGRFILMPRFDARWAIIDREFKYDVVVFCSDRNEAEIILAALNREVPSRVKRWSRSMPVRPNPA
jgi:hypothetical protein